MGVDESESAFSLYERFLLGQNLSGPENMVFGQRRWSRAIQRSWMSISLFDNTEMHNALIVLFPIITRHLSDQCQI